MRRPPELSGETVRLNPITHPTQVIRRLVRREEAPGGVNPAIVSGLYRAAPVCIVAGLFVAGLGFTNVFVPVLILGFTFVAAGFCLVTLAELLTPDALHWDGRLQAWLQGRGKR